MMYKVNVIEKFIEIINDELYEEIGDRLYNSDAICYFMNGGCFQFVEIMKYYFNDSIIMLNKDYTHCCIMIDNNLYDASGKLEDKNNYKIANDIDILYCKNYFGFNEYKYVNNELLVERIIRSINSINFSFFSDKKLVKM